MLRFMLSIGSIFLLSFLNFHPLHVSVTEIEYDEKDKALEIVMRVFADDLEITFKDRFNDPELDILQPKKRSLDEMMAEYLNDRFAVMLDNKNQPFRYLGHEREGDAFVFFVEVAKVKKWKSISVTNAVIMETYADQSNLVHVTAYGKVRSLRLTKSNSSGVLTFL